MKKLLSGLLAVTLIAGTLLGSLTASAKAADYKEGFVYSEGTHFYLDGEKFYFAGANAYDFFTKQSNGGKDIGKEEIDLRMSQMKEIGINVIRVWGFGSRDGYRFEDGVGDYNEGTFSVMDYTMKSAKENGIRVIITLENYWDAYGGIDQKLQWAGLSGGSHANRRQFFTNETCKKRYKDYFNYFANRVNTFTGVQYKNDPTVFAWDMMNEARYCNDSNYSDPENLKSTKLRAWVDEMGAYMKSVDSNHMVCVGLEGHGTKYNFGGNEGNDFVYVQSSEYIDFTSAHPYPDEYWANMTPAQTKTMMQKWINDSHNLVGKPFMVGEFNVSMNNSQLEEYWRAIFDTIDEMDAGGGLFWTFDTRSLGHFHVQITDSIIQDYFMGHCEKMLAKNNGGTTIPDGPTDTDTDTTTDTTTDTGTDTDTAMDTDTSTDISTDTDTDTDTSTDTATDTNTDTATDTDTNTDIDSNTDTDLSTDTDTSTDVDTNSDTDTDISFELGDVNADGSVDILDVVLLRSHIVGNSVLSIEELARADMNVDIEIDILDVVLIRNKIVNA